MFLGEVAGKRVVVQGLWIGGWCWGEDLPRRDDKDGRKAMEDGLGEGTRAPRGSGGHEEARREVLERTRGGWGTVMPRTR